jgi:hypothetical protein
MRFEGGGFLHIRYVIPLFLFLCWFFYSVFILDNFLSCEVGV